MAIDSTVGRRYRVACISCDGKTWHVVLASSDDDGVYDEVDVRYEVHSQVLQCAGCGTTTFRQEYWDDSGQNDSPSVSLFPPRLAGRKQLVKKYLLPAQIERIYSETHTCLVSGLPILATVGVRALIEAVCRTEKAAGQTLERRIDDLVVKGVLTAGGAEILHKARFLGNEAAHELTAPRPIVLGAAMEVAEHLLQTVYILPAIAQRLSDK